MLRHAPETIGLELDEHGWSSTAELMTKSKSVLGEINIEMINEVVHTNDKQRFALNEDSSKIRANQGHSLKTVDLALEAKTPPSILYHGTASKNIESIKANGIDKRQRQHVHLSADLETATKVGARHGKPVILRIDTVAMSQEGCLFYLSENQVWLTDFIDSKYIKI